MANPQPDKFTRISNELIEAIMQTDFSKRQRSIIDLIIRVSYGCGKKYALLNPSDFEVVGVYKSHIRKELDYLERAKVIFIDGEQVCLNKDYDQWRVSLNRTCNQQKLSEILRKNLNGEVTITVTKVTKTVTENGANEGGEVTKTVTGGYQNSNSVVTKTVTGTPPSTPPESGPKPCLKKLKDNIKETTTTNIVSTLYSTPENNEPNGAGSRRRLFKFYENHFPGTISPLVMEKMETWLEDTESPLVLYALEKAVLAEKRSYTYVEGILRNWTGQGIRTRKDAELAEINFQRRKNQGQGQLLSIPPAPVDKPLTAAERERLQALAPECERISKEMGFP